jgi:hypothetical protein
LEAITKHKSWPILICILGISLGTRVYDATLAGLILITLIYLGSLFLLIDIPRFNPVNPASLATVVLGMFLGLAFGLFAGNWYTKEQLKVLAEKTEFQGLGSKRIYFALFLGLTVFLVCSLFFIYYRALVLSDSLVSFVISATFTAYIIRIILVASWEKKTRKLLMMSWNKFYVISK